MSPAIFPTITGLALLGALYWSLRMIWSACSELYAISGGRGMVLGAMATICGIFAILVWAIATP